MSHPFLFIGLFVALISTVGVLIFGLFALFKGGEFNRMYGNWAMRWRILLQALTIILFTILLIVGR